eukprot:1552921-Pyramimonas_sp.AAC.1
MPPPAPRPTAPVAAAAGAGDATVRPVGQCWRSQWGSPLRASPPRRSRSAPQPRAGGEARADGNQQQDEL